LSRIGDGAAEIILIIYPHRSSGGHSKDNWSGGRDWKARTPEAVPFVGELRDLGDADDGRRRLWRFGSWSLRVGARAFLWNDASDDRVRLTREGLDFQQGPNHCHDSDDEARAARRAVEEVARRAFAPGVPKPLTSLPGDN